MTRNRLLFTVPLLALCHTSLAAPADPIGLGALRALVPTLDGDGNRLAQVEAPLDDSFQPAYQVNPGGVRQPPAKFTFFSGPPTTNSAQSATTFPNALGTVSGHANAVASFLYGLPGGISTNVAAIDNYEATYFFETVVPELEPIPAQLVNQTFVVPGSSEEQVLWDKAYDDYADTFNTLFISGIGNGGPIFAPASSHNGIGAGAIGGYSSVGPLLDGRSKPDLVAPAEVTSYSTPLVAGAATLLLQAALRGDGGDIHSATDSRTLKALLINGAVKPKDWNATPPAPLDRRYGSGVVNVFNSYVQLTGGKQSPGCVITGTNRQNFDVEDVPLISQHSGWDLSTISATDGPRSHVYRFHIPGSATVTATLVWNRRTNAAQHTNLDLFLADASSRVIAASTSHVDNVEHVFVSQLKGGTYSLEVRHPGMEGSESDTYALAFVFAQQPLSIRASNGAVRLSWPDYPAGNVLQTAETISGKWESVDHALTQSNRWYQVEIPMESDPKFFRLAPAW